MLIIKVGGGADINIPGVVNDLAALDDPFVVILGANALRDSIGERLAMTKQELTSLSGYTSVYSDESAIDLIMMTYAGLRNRRFAPLPNSNTAISFALNEAAIQTTEADRVDTLALAKLDKTTVAKASIGHHDKVYG